MNNKFFTRVVLPIVWFTLCPWYYFWLAAALLVIVFVFIPHRKIFLLVLLSLPYTLGLACALYSELVCGSDPKKFRTFRLFLVKTWYCRI
jgi:hypothetical protein